jgi:hypothetical protein
LNSEFSAILAATAWLAEPTSTTMRVNGSASWCGLSQYDSLVGKGDVLERSKSSSNSSFPSWSWAGWVGHIEYEKIVETAKIETVIPSQRQLFQIQRAAGV